MPSVLNDSFDGGMLIGEIEILFGMIQTDVKQWNQWYENSQHVLRKNPASLPVKSIPWDTHLRIQALFLLLVIKTLHLARGSQSIENVLKNTTLGARERYRYGKKELVKNVLELMGYFRDALVHPWDSPGLETSPARAPVGTYDNQELTFYYPRLIIHPPTEAEKDGSLQIANAKITLEKLKSIVASIKASGES